MPTIRVSALRWVPPFAQGLVRDLRVRWALEEAGIEYEENLLGLAELESEEYRKLNPFQVVPTYEEDGLVIFESGAILLHVAAKSAALMPEDASGRARVGSWIFAALNTIEPHLFNLADIDLFHAGEPWAKERRPEVIEALTERLQDVSLCLGDREYLEDGRFTVADLLMTTVLRIPRHTDVVKGFPNLEALRLRCEARPAFKKALAAQMAPFAENAPAKA